MTAEKKDYININGKFYPVKAWHKVKTPDGSTSIPEADIKMMSDFKWQYMGLIDRLKNPDSYAELLGEDVPAVIEQLVDWLREHIADIETLGNEQDICQCMEQIMLKV